ncbi:hypothetical protein ACWDG1_07490 [Streptomyces sp. NPDC001177]
MGGPECLEALTMLQELGDCYGQATTWDSNALAILRELGVPCLEAVALIRIGDTHLATGDHDAVRAS